MRESAAAHQNDHSGGTPVRLLPEFGSVHGRGGSMAETLKTAFGLPSTLPTTAPVTDGWVLGSDGSAALRPPDPSAAA